MIPAKPSDSVDVNANFESCIVRVEAPPPPCPNT